MPETLIKSEVDFETDGKHHGFLRLPHSVHRSAYGWIPVPVVVVKNGDGNLNRIFPGNPHGNPTQMIAHYIEEVLMPMCDYMFDFHSGGSSLIYPPTMLRGKGHSPQERAKLLELQEAFDIPYAWVFTSGGGPTTTARTAMGAAGRKGVISIMAELGGGGTVSPAILVMTKRGIKRMLHCIGMLPDYQPDAANGTRELQVIGSIYAYDSGLFEPFREPGNEISAGDDVGAIHHPDEPWQLATNIPSCHDGIILCGRFPGRVERGDCLYQIAADTKEIGQ